MTADQFFNELHEISMRTSSYPPPIRLSQAFDPEKFSGGVSGSEITRRSFLKRTGGATVATLVAWNLATREAGAHIIEDSASIPQFRMRITDCLPKSSAPPTTPEGLFDSKQVTWLAVGYNFSEGGKQYGTRLETTITWDTDPSVEFCQLWYLLVVRIEVKVIVNLYKYELTQPDNLISVFSSEGDGNWGGERVAVIYCDCWSGDLISDDLPFWQRTRQVNLGGVNHNLVSELTTEIAGSGSSCLTVKFSPETSLATVNPPDVKLWAPELFDDQDCFATEWESFQIEPE